MTSRFKLRAARKALVTSVPDPRPVRSVCDLVANRMWKRGQWLPEGAGWE